MSGGNRAQERVELLVVPDAGRGVEEQEDAHAFHEALGGGDVERGPVERVHLVDVEILFCFFKNRKIKIENENKIKIEIKIEIKSKSKSKKDFFFFFFFFN